MTAHINLAHQCAMVADQKVGVKFSSYVIFIFIVELLWRLGILGDWEKYSFFPWETKPTHQLRNMTTRKCGWVARLTSGRPNQELQGTSHNRNYHRILGIHRFIDHLDDRVMRNQSSFDDHKILFIQPEKFDEMRRKCWIGDEKCISLRDGLLNSYSLESAVSVISWESTITIF
jgi:hypothetical protein